MKSIAFHDNLTLFLILNADKTMVKISYFDYFIVYFGFVFSGLKICRKQLMKYLRASKKQRISG